MAFVSVPKDLTKVKNKIIFNLTKRQLICLGIAAAVGLPFYFLSRGLIGSSNAATGMCLLMLPAFLFAMYHSSILQIGQICLGQSAYRTMLSREMPIPVWLRIFCFSRKGTGLQSQNQTGYS